MVPIGWRLAEPEIAYIIDDAEAKVLFLGDEFEAAASSLGKRPGLIACYSAGEARKLLREAPRGTFAPSAPDEAVLQSYTSGTTGKPKGVVLSNRNFTGLRQTGLVKPHPYTLLDDDESYLIAMPVAHVAGTAPGFISLVQGVPGIVLAEFEPARVFDAIENRGVTRAVIVPPRCS
jgi:fatty-acyl-CoA synthase